jgi:hypothetical protein
MLSYLAHIARFLTFIYCAYLLFMFDLPFGAIIIIITYVLLTIYLIRSERK